MEALMRHFFYMSYPPSFFIPLIALFMQCGIFFFYSYILRILYSKGQRGHKWLARSPSIPAIFSYMKFIIHRIILTGMLDNFPDTEGQTVTTRRTPQNTHGYKRAASLQHTYSVHPYISLEQAIYF